MALPYASIPRFHLHRLQTARGLLLGNTNPIRSSELTKGLTRSQLQPAGTITASCGIRLTSFDALGSYDTTRCMRTLAASVPENLHTAPSEYMQGLVIADLDPATAKVAISIMGPFLSAFGFLFIIRIVMSWYPKLPVAKFPYVIAYAPTEPLLRVTRKLIPPLGGVDVTPVVWFGMISFLNEILVGPQGLLVLLSQQV